MNRSDWRFWIALLALSLAGLGPASAAPNSCNRTTVFYVNGVFNFDLASAEASTRDIRAALAAYGVQDAGILRIRTVWNPGSVLGDLEEVGIDQSELLEYVAGKARRPPPIEGFAKALALAVGEQDSQAERRQVIERIKEELLRVLVETKTPIVAIAHSQGNIYLNAAVAELQSQEATRNLPGVRNIGVLGLGVAATNESVEALPIHRYITAQGDIIIDELLRLVAKSLPPANFLNVAWSQRTGGDLIRHEISGTYLSKATGEMPAGFLWQFSEKFVDHFKQLRSEVEAGWPCASGGEVPATVTQFNEASLKVRVHSRPDDIRQPQGLVEFFVGGVPTCLAPIAPDGVARCPWTFRMPPGEYAVTYRVALNEPFRWTSDPESDRLGTITVEERLSSNVQFLGGYTFPHQVTHFDIHNSATDYLKDRIVTATRSEGQIRLYDLFGVLRLTYANRYYGLSDVAFHPNGQIYVAQGAQFHVLNQDGSTARSFGSYGTGPGQNRGEVRIDVLSDAVIVADIFDHRVQVLDLHGNQIREFGNTGTAFERVNFPHHAVFNRATGEYYVLGCHAISYVVCGARISVYSADGRFLRKFGRWDADGTANLEGNAGIGLGSFGAGLALDAAHGYVFLGTGAGTTVFDLNGNYLGGIANASAVSFDALNEILYSGVFGGIVGSFGEVHAYKFQRR
jgi:hypothetical protein